MESTIIIRRYREEDFSGIARVHDGARKNELELAGLSEAFLPLAVAAEREGLMEYELYVAEENQQIVGFVAFEAEEIAWLYVDADHTRRGIGRSLMEFALQRVNPTADIEVLAGNVPALALYESCGFHIEKTVHGVMPGNEAFAVTVHVLKR